MGAAIRQYLQRIVDATAMRRLRADKGAACTHSRGWESAPCKCHREKKKKNKKSQEEQIDTNAKKIENT